MAFKKAVWRKKRCRLPAETVQSASLALQGVDNVHGSDGLSLGVLSIGNGVTDHVLQENLENTTSLLIDEAGDTLHTTSASQTTDGWFGDPLDVVTKNLSVALGTSFSETLASFSTSRHADVLSKVEEIFVRTDRVDKFLSPFMSKFGAFFLSDPIVKPKQDLKKH